MGRPREHDEATRVALLEATERLVARDGCGGAVRPRRRAEAGHDHACRLQPVRLEGRPSRRGDRESRVRVPVRRDRKTPRRQTTQPPIWSPSASVHSVGSCSSIPASIASPSSVSFRASPRRPRAHRGAAASVGAAAREDRADSTQPACSREMCVEEAAIAFNAMLEGLGNAELRGNVLRVLPQAGEEEAWRSALHTVVRGFTKTTRAQLRPINSRARRSRRGKPAPSERD